MEQAKDFKQNQQKLHTFEELRENYSVYITNQKDRDDIERAYKYMLKKHEGQFRRSGEPYYHHLIEVAYILTTLQCGPATITAGLLHDVVEDTGTPIEEIQQGWGDDVAKIVESLTKIQRLKLSRMKREDFAAEDHRKIFLGMAKDIRVIIVKLADRLHNMRTLDSMPMDRQLGISRETLDVFVPIAHRLGINVIKSELEDLCLKHLEPERYAEIEKLLSNYKNAERQRSLDNLAKRIADIIFEHNIPFEIKTRIKSYYSIYQKMYHKGKKFDEIYDVLALRIITDDEIQCYEILGLIHQTYRPIPGRFKDYIAMPKPNMYQSLHTTIISGDGNIYEVQIRTKEMDNVAETGIAAHWGYKEGQYNKIKEQKEIEDQLHWFRDLVSMSDDEDSANAKEYMNALTEDIFEANVYVFSPKGKVIELVKGSTPLDFAYKIHTKVGESAVGAIVNNVLVPLNTQLVTGDVVEIKTSKNAPGPNEKWLDFVATNNAKSNIRKFLYKKNSEAIREEYIKKGHQTILDVCRERNLTNEQEIRDLMKEKDVLEHFQLDSYDELCLAVQGKNISPTAIADYLGLEKVVKQNFKKGPNISKSPVFCKGAGNVAITLARCCSPIPGDPIVGYITRGKGITVHRTNCPNIQHEKMRLVDVYWNEDIQTNDYQVDISIESTERPQLLNDIVSVLANQKVNLTAINASINPQNQNVTIRASILVPNADKLRSVFNAILNVKSVFLVDRVIH